MRMKAGRRRNCKGNRECGLYRRVSVDVLVSRTAIRGNNEVCCPAKSLISRNRWYGAAHSYAFALIQRG